MYNAEVVGLVQIEDIKKEQRLRYVVESLQKSELLFVK